MGERLRVVAEMVAGRRVHLLGVEAERAARARARSSKPLGRLGDPAGAGERLDEPERARQERAFGAGEAVAAGRVAVEQRAAGVELAADGVDGAADARRVAAVRCRAAGGRAARRRGRRSRRCGCSCRGSASKPAARTSSAMASRSARHRRAAGPEVRRVSAMRSARSRASQAMSLECTWCGASPRISQIPASGSRHRSRDLVGEAAHGPPRLGVEAVAGVGEQPGGVEDPAVAVELVLVGGAVADPHRAAVGVAGPAVERRVPRPGGLPWRVSSTGRRGRSRRLAWSSQARNVRASSCLPTPRKAPMPMLASRGQA